MGITNAGIFRYYFFLDAAYPAIAGTSNNNTDNITTTYIRHLLRFHIIT